MTLNKTGWDNSGGRYQFTPPTPAHGDGDVIAQAVEVSLRPVLKALRLKTWQIRIGALAIVILLAASAVLGYDVQQNRDNANSLRQQSVASCVAGNQFRNNQTLIWEKNYALQAELSKSTSSLLQQFIAAVAANDPARIKTINDLLVKSGKASQNEVNTFLAYVKKVDTPRNCSEAFRNTSGVGADPNSGTPVQAKEVAALSPQVVYLKSWNGQCLTIPTASAGARVRTTSCAVAHGWWYYPTAGTGTFRPSGHSDVALGDSGGYGALVPSSNNGSDIAADGAATGPDGLTYDRLYIVPLSTDGRLHANGLNSNVSVQRVLSSADYWALTVDGHSQAAVPAGTVPA